MRVYSIDSADPGRSSVIANFFLEAALALRFNGGSPGSQRRRQFPSTSIAADLKIRTWSHGYAFYGRSSHAQVQFIRAILTPIVSCPATETPTLPSRLRQARSPMSGRPCPAQRYLNIQLQGVGHGRC